MLTKTPSTLTADGMLRLRGLQADAVTAVTDQFYAMREPPEGVGREAFREELTFHIEFLRPVLEFGMAQPMVNYLIWLESVLKARGQSAEHLSQSLDSLANFFLARMPFAEGAVVADSLRSVRETFTSGKASYRPTSNAESAWPEAEEFEKALLSGNQRAALAIVTRAQESGKSLVEIESQLMQAALYHIGELWQDNRVSVAQEHMASAIIQSIMTVALVRSTPPVPTGNRVLLACVAGNIHAIGLRMVADAFQLGGWDVQYLGANVPSLDVIKQVKTWRPALVGLSVVFAQHLSVAREVIALLESELGIDRPSVIIGGLAMNRFSELANFVGADSCRTDAASAVDYANQLVRA